MGFWVYTALDEMEECVAFSMAGIGEVGHGADHFAAGGEGQLDGIVEAASGEALEPCSIRPAPPDTRGKTFEDFSFLCLDFVSVAPVGEIEAPVGSEEGAVETRGVEDVPTGEKDFAVVGDAVAVVVVEAEEVGRACDEEAALVPEYAHWEAEFGGEDCACVVDAVAVGIFEAEDLTFRFGGHFLA